MSDLTNYAETKIGDHTLGLASWTMPTDYLSLHTADPTETGSFTDEVTEGGYARQNATTAMGATNATTGVSVNEDVVEFGPASEDWGTITHVGYDDGDTEGAGNMLIHVALSSSRLIQNGDSLRFSASQLSVTFA